MIDRKELKKAAKTYNGDKYSEEFYSYYLEILQKNNEINESIKKAVKYLLLWKLGKIRSKQTPKSVKIDFMDSISTHYYAINLPEKQARVIEKAIEEERLRAALDFSMNLIDLSEFKNYADNLTSSSIVIPAFYVHIWRPQEFPILDEKVWKVYCKEKGEGTLSKYTKPKSWSDFDNYTKFFNKIIDETSLDWRVIDKGLWVMGGLLKGKKNTKKEAKITDQEEVKLLNIGKFETSNFSQIPNDLFSQVCNKIEKNVGHLPFKNRGIIINRDLIRYALEILNAEKTKALPQNCRNSLKIKTPDGLDRRIKERTKSDLRTANIISDVLKEANIVEVVQIQNPKTGRYVKGTRLLPDWHW